MPPSKSNNNLNRKRRRRRGAEQKKLGMRGSKEIAIYRARTDAMITTTTETGENVERRTAAGGCHTKTTGVVVAIISDDVPMTVMMTLTDNGNAEGGIQVRTTTSGVITIEKESEEVPWSRTIDLVVGGRVLRSGNALAALRAAKNGNAGTATPKHTTIIIDPVIGLPRVTILRTVRVERSQSATAPQTWNHDASLRLAPMRTRKTRVLLEIAPLRRTSLQRRLLVATLLKASLTLPLADRVLPILQKTKSDRRLHLTFHPKWINTSRPIMTLVWTSHQSWPLMGSCHQAVLRGGMPCCKSFGCGGRKRRRRSGCWRSPAKLQRRLPERSMTSSLLSTRSVVLPESGMKGRSHGLRSMTFLVVSVGSKALKHI